MIENVLDHINGEIEDLDQFANRYGLCELGTVRDDKQAPFRYIASGNKEFIDWDRNAPLVYHRMTGETEREAIESPSAKSNVIRETTPMRCVAFLRRDKGADDAYTPMEVGRNLAGKIAIVQDQTLRAALNMKSVKATVVNINPNPEDVWENETENMANKVPSSYNLVSVDYEIEFIGRAGCFPEVTC